MRTRSLQLWASSETCLVMPGDGGYELRLYSMINLGCVPVIIYTAGITLPKVPFASQLPWHDFAIFWDLGHLRGAAKPDGTVNFRAATEQMLNQLLSLDPDVLARKRAALVKHGPKLGWSLRRSCEAPEAPGAEPPPQTTALDLLVRELAARARNPTVDDSTRHYWKLPLTSIYASLDEDLSASGCPNGFPFCQRSSNLSMGDLCRALADDLDWRCPVGCTQVRGPPYCFGTAAASTSHAAKVAAGFLPCRAAPTCKQVLPEEADMSFNGFPKPPRRPKIVLLSFSDRPALRTATWQSLQRFCDARPGRYQLELYTEALLDERDFHPAWNKLAMIKRAFSMGELDAVVWVDDDVVITAPDGVDPIFDTIVTKLFANEDTYALASQEWVDSKLAGADRKQAISTAIFALKRNRHSRGLIKQLFQIARRLAWPRQGRAWDQSALVHFLNTEQASSKGFELLPPGALWKRVVGTGSAALGVVADEELWHPGDFAAHLSDIPTARHRVEVTRWLLQESSAVELRNRSLRNPLLTASARLSVRGGLRAR